MLAALSQGPGASRSTGAATTATAAATTATAAGRTGPLQAVQPLAIITVPSPAEQNKTPQRFVLK